MLAEGLSCCVLGLLLIIGEGLSPLLYSYCLGVFHVVYLARVSFAEQFKRVFLAVYLVRVSVA